MPPWLANPKLAQMSLSLYELTTTEIIYFVNVDQAISKHEFSVKIRHFLPTSITSFFLARALLFINGFLGFCS